MKMCVCVCANVEIGSAGMPLNLPSIAHQVITRVELWLLLLKCNARAVNNWQ
jgi:hypothetical protein